MNTKSQKKKALSEAEIDTLVVAHADDDSAWEKPISVRQAKRTVSLSAELAARAAFLARLHRQASVEEWLTRVIRERIELEEAAFADVKRKLAKNGS